MRNVLILCTGNSARSILGEAIFTDCTGGIWRGYSAGSQPTGAPNPFALQTLKAHGHDTTFVRSKSWEEFAGVDAPPMDLIITVCDSAAAETCPIWPGHPATAHWGLPDPAAVTGSDEDKLAAFEATYSALKSRVDRLLALTGDIPDILPQIRIIGEETP